MLMTQQGTMKEDICKKSKNVDEVVESNIPRGGKGE